MASFFSSIFSSSSHSSNLEINRKSLKRPDEFFLVLYRFIDSLIKNPRIVITVLILFLLLGGGLVFLNTRQNTRAIAAQNAFYSAQKTLEKEMKAISDSTDPITTAGDVSKGKNEKKKDVEAQRFTHQKLDVEIRLSESIKQLKAVIDEFSKTQAAYEACVTIGGLYYNHQEASKAIPWYQQAVELAPTAFERAIALISLGYAYEEEAKWPEALQFYEKAFNLGEASLKGNILLAMARTHEVQKNTQKAKGIYDQILSQMPNTEYAKTAEIFKSQLE